MQPFRTAVANRQHFRRSDKRVHHPMFWPPEFKPVLRGHHPGIEGLLFLIGSMTLAIVGGSLNEYYAGLRGGNACAKSACGGRWARKAHIRFGNFSWTWCSRWPPRDRHSFPGGRFHLGDWNLPFLGPAYETISG